MKKLSFASLKKVGTPILNALKSVFRTSKKIGSRGLNHLKTAGKFLLRKLKEMMKRKEKPPKKGVGAGPKVGLAISLIVVIALATITLAGGGVESGATAIRGLFVGLGWLLAIIISMVVVGILAYLASSKAREGDLRSLGWVVWVIVLAAAGAVAWWYSGYLWSVLTELPKLLPTTILGWLAPFLILVGGLYALGCLDKKGSVSTSVRKIAATAAILALTLAAVLWYEGAPLGSGALFEPTLVCRGVGNQQAQTCQANTRWTTWFKPLDGTPNGLNLCYNSSGPVEVDYKLEGGFSYHRFRSKSGTSLVTYQYERGTTEDPCPKKL